MNAPNGTTKVILGHAVRKRLGARDHVRVISQRLIGLVLSPHDSSPYILRALEVLRVGDSREGRDSPSLLLTKR